ncbi:hypothetical protein ANCCAN_26444 [Ancylostoma caninum]|uniref:RSE1/DDB1/CPSF1 C-terminal domain-containing protein n=1 Tax=Ancylostoma caninum TaxID=29170 RepID=A0A368F9Y6_ANCCA|nr:hypothetical protein ANCCAN_26444 [Ancylostoma caninum]
MHVRANFPPLCGRDHLAFRSYYHPCKNVIDGDLCEQFGLMDAAAQREVTEGLDRTTSEVDFSIFLNPPPTPPYQKRVNEGVVSIIFLF